MAPRSRRWDARSGGWSSGRARKGVEGTATSRCASAGAHDVAGSPHGHAPGDARSAPRSKWGRGAALGTPDPKQRSNAVGPFSRAAPGAHQKFCLDPFESRAFLASVRPRGSHSRARHGGRSRRDASRGSIRRRGRRPPARGTRSWFPAASSAGGRPGGAGGRVAVRRHPRRRPRGPDDAPLRAARRLPGHDVVVRDERGHVRGEVLRARRQARGADVRDVLGRGAEPAARARASRAAVRRPAPPDEARAGRRRDVPRGRRPRPPRPPRRAEPSATRSGTTRRPAGAARHGGGPGGIARRSPRPRVVSSTSESHAGKAPRAPARALAPRPRPRRDPKTPRPPRRTHPWTTTCVGGGADDHRRDSDAEPSDADDDDVDVDVDDASSEYSSASEERERRSRTSFFGAVRLDEPGLRSAYLRREATRRAEARALSADRERLRERLDVGPAAPSSIRGRARTDSASARRRASARGRGRGRGREGRVARAERCSRGCWSSRGRRGGGRGRGKEGGRARRARVNPGRSGSGIIFTTTRRRRRRRGRRAAAAKKTRRGKAAETRGAGLLLPGRLRAARAAGAGAPPSVIGAARRRRRRSTAGVRALAGLMRDSLGRCALAESERDVAAECGALMDRLARFVAEGKEEEEEE